MEQGYPAYSYDLNNNKDLIRLPANNYLRIRGNCHRLGKRASYDECGDLDDNLHKTAKNTTSGTFKSADSYLDIYNTKQLHHHNNNDINYSYITRSSPLSQSSDFTQKESEDCETNQKENFYNSSNTELTRKIFWVQHSLAIAALGYESYADYQ